MLITEIPKAIKRIPVIGVNKPHILSPIIPVIRPLNGMDCASPFRYIFRVLARIDIFLDARRNNMTEMSTEKNEKSNTRKTGIE